MDSSKRSNEAEIRFLHLKNENRNSFGHLYQNYFGHKRKDQSRRVDSTNRDTKEKTLEAKRRSLADLKSHFKLSKNDGIGKSVNGRSKYDSLQSKLGIGGVIKGDYHMLMGQMKPGLSKKRGMKSNFHAKRSSLNSKENKKGLSHFNLNGIITLGGKGIYGLANRSIKTKPHKVLKRGNKSSNFNFTVLKKNLSSKQNVLYSSLNQPGGRMGFNRSQK